MKILITGSSGFIGTATLNRLIDAGHDVLGIDVKEPGPLALGHEFRKINILNQDELAEAFSAFQPDAVIHLAAHMSLRQSADHEYRYRANTLGTENLIQCIRNCDAVERAIYTSTKYVYRHGEPKGPRDYLPDSHYGESKATMEKMIWEEDGGGVSWCITRPTTIWGPGMSFHYKRFLRLVEKGRYVHIGGGKFSKSMGYVGNAAFQHLKLLEAEQDLIHKKVFYITDYEPVLLKDWVERFGQAFGKEKFLSIPRPIALGFGKVGDIVQKCGVKRFPFTTFRVKNLTESETCDASLTEEVCGPLEYSMEQGVTETVDWFQNL